jgi:hypothetical protein
MLRKYGCFTEGTKLDGMKQTQMLSVTIYELTQLQFSAAVDVNKVHASEPRKDFAPPPASPLLLGFKSTLQFF